MVQFWAFSEAQHENVAAATILPLDSAGIAVLQGVTRGIDRVLRYYCDVKRVVLCVCYYFLSRNSECFLCRCFVTP